MYVYMFVPVYMSVRGGFCEGQDSVREKPGRQVVVRNRPTQPQELETGPPPVEQVLLATGPSLQSPLHTLGGMFIYPKLSSKQHSYVGMDAEQLAWLTRWLRDLSSTALAQRQCSAHETRSHAILFPAYK